MFKLAKTNRRKFYLSDTHLGHEAILDYTDRAEVFESIEDHDAKLLGLINDVVQPNDELYFIGDVAMYKSVWKCVAAVDEIRCKYKYLVVGNHDFKKLEAYEAAGVFAGISNMMVVFDGDATLHLSHFPIAHWLKAEHGSYMIHGHMHGDTSTIQELQKYRVMDVGIDALAELRNPDAMRTLQDYAPASLHEIITAMDKRQIMQKRHGAS